LTPKASIQINETYCSVCTICSSVCPFEAISTIKETGEVKLDIEKCQVCGICVSACPVSAIETAYYDSDSLISYIRKSMRETGLNSLVLTCRSNSTLPKVKEALKKQGLEEFISLRLPCVGRVSPRLLLRALDMGIGKLIVVPCEEGYCRFKEGSRINTRRFKLLQALLDQLNLGTVLTVIRGLPKAHIETDGCVSCGDCVEVCPNEAIQLASTPRVAELNVDKCSGCGACAVVCPTLAIKVEGFEHEAISRSIFDSRLLINKMKKGKKPTVLVFCCQWSEFSALDEIQSSILKDNILFMELPCAARVESLHILEAFHTGFDGVLVAACKKGECKLGKGSEKAERRISTLKKLLSQVNLENRLEIRFMSPKYLGEFNTHLNSFVETVKKLGPLRLDEDKKIRLEGVIEALNTERPRLILERSQILLEKGENVFGETVSQEEFDEMLQTIENEFMKRRIRVSMGEDALSAKEIAQRIEASPREVLKNLISLERDGLVSVVGIEGNSPKYRRAGG